MLANKMQNKKPKKQIDKFKQAAKELECDEDESKFNAKIEKITRYKKLNIENNL